MKLKEIISFLEEKVPTNLALDFDNVGLMGDYDLDSQINSIKIFMDLTPDFDNFNDNTLIITHHPPIFTPKTPTYTIHSNWDIIDGGANEALCETLKLDVIDYFDDKTHIGRVCKSNHSLKETVLENFKNIRIVNNFDDHKNLKVGVISGFGLKNPDYIKLAKKKDLDVLISGDLCQETAILANNLNITLIDLGHHESEVPGLYELEKVINELNIDVEIIDKNPIEVIK